MANTLRIKRRAAGGAAGAPASLANAELAFNEQDDVLYYGKGTGGAGGTATTVLAIGGPGFAVSLTGSYANPTWITSLAASKLTGTVSVSQGGTGLGTYTVGDIVYASGAAALTALAGPTAATKRFLTSTGTGTVAQAPAWGSIVDGDLPTALTGKTYNALSLTANATGFSVAGGTTAKTLTVSNSITLSGTDASTLNIGAGGTLGTGAFATIANYAPLASPGFSGTPTTPTAAADTNTTQIASTAYVLGQASSTSPAMSGTAAVGTSLRYARADHVHPTDTSRAPLASPGLSGTPTAPTAAVDTNTTQIATTAYVIAQGYLKSATASSTYAPLASPGLTGTPTATTAVADTNSTQIATTAYVIGQASAVAGAALGTAATGTSLRYARADHVHAMPTLSQVGLPTAAVSLNSQRITNLAEPTNAQDAATKNYVDSVAQGLDVKASVVVATTANITLSALQTIDGISVVANDRVLVKNQTAPAENGVYLAQSGAWTRATDMDAWTEFVSAFFFVERGTTQADSGWVCTVDPGGTLGTTAVAFAQFSGSGSYQGGAGLTLTGNIFAVGAGTGITVNADDVALTGQALALHSLATSGLITRTGAGTVAGRSIATSGTGISVSNGDGVAANPTLSLSAALSTFGGLTPAADQLPYYTGAAAAALTTLSAFGRSLIDDADAATARTTLGLGSMATQASTSVSISGGSITNLTTFDGITIDGGTF